MKKENWQSASLVRKLKQAPTLVAVAILIVASSATVVRATATCNSIAECQQQIVNDNNAVADLQSIASSYQDAINKLQSQINGVQSEISINEGKQVQLQAEIEDAQKKLDYEKSVLGQDLKAMYVGGKMSTVEMLATSNDLSSFVDAATYRSAVQGKIQTTLADIARLQNQLKDQKAEVERLLATEQAQQAQLAAARLQQQQLLSYNQTEQATYTARASQNQQKLEALIAAQRAANDLSASYYFIRFPGTIQHDPINGSYPYAHAGFGMTPGAGCFDNDGPDQWGYCTRQCVSYAAWAVVYSGRSAPYFWGNAKDWVGAARTAGIPVYTYPQPGDIAISTAGTWGHAMYVESVSGNQIYVSQYNQQLTGQFSTQWRTWE